MCVSMFVVFKQKKAYEMRMSDWSSDVCSSDLTTCFIRTLESVEHDRPAMAARANAWATGDLQAWRELPDSEREDACVAALTGAGFAQNLGLADVPAQLRAVRSEEHTSELQSLMRTSYAVFCLKKKNKLSLA